MDDVKRLLREQFPNLQRSGCPGRDILQKLASHRMPLSEAQAWLDHLGNCSPCFLDFEQFHLEFQRLRRIKIIAAILVVAVALLVTAWFSQRRKKNSAALWLMLNCVAVVLQCNKGRNFGGPLQGLSSRGIKMSLQYRGGDGPN